MMSRNAEVLVPSPICIYINIFLRVHFYRSILQGEYSILGVGF